MSRLKMQPHMVFGVIFMVFITESVLSEDAHEYNPQEEVFVVANTIRPYSNPTETYHYYKLPFCKPKERQWDDHDLGELLTGSRKIVTDYQIYFGVDQSYAKLCKVVITSDILKQFQDSIDEDYIFEMYVDEIQLSGQVGMVTHKTNGVRVIGDYYLNTHLHFDIAHNDGSDPQLKKSLIVGVNMSTAANAGTKFNSEYQYHLSEENVQKMPEAVFTYSVKWHHRPDLKYEDRLSKDPLLPDNLEIHWLSIINSFILVMLLIAFLSVIMVRILKRDFSRYMDIEEGDDIGLQEETGWKLVHAEVFRTPPFLNVFCAFVGAGAQLFAMLLGVLVLSLMDVFHPTKRGGIVTAIIVVYAFTASIGGYRSASLYKQLGGQRWVWNIILCSFIVPGPLLGIFAFLNTVAIWNDSSAALPFGTIMILLCLFLLITIPLTIIGGIAGRNTTNDFNAPCRTNKIPREIPYPPWYRSSFVQILMAGCLPYSAVYIELHHIFAAIWGHQIYTLFGILFLAFIMLVFVTCFMTISLTYFQLSSEDHRWWWRSYLSGGVTGLFVFAYSVWYYYTSTEMTGFFQSAFYFGYSGMMSYCFFVMLGFLGFQSALIFVKKIYFTIKVE